MPSRLQSESTKKVGANEMQAVIVTGGKQYSVKEGDTLYIEKLNAEAESTVTFDQVLAVLDGENSKFGAPVVAGASVEAKVLKNGKGKRLPSSSSVPRRTPSPSRAIVSLTPRCRSKRSPCNDKSRVFRSGRQNLRIYRLGPQRLC